MLPQNFGATGHALSIVKGAGCDAFKISFNRVETTLRVASGGCVGMHGRRPRIPTLIPALLMGHAMVAPILTISSMEGHGSDSGGELQRMRIP